MLVVNTVLVFRAGFHELRDVVLHGSPLVYYRGQLSSRSPCARSPAACC